MKVYLISLILFISFNAAYAEQSVEGFGNEYYTEYCKRFVACGDDAGIAELASMARIKDVESCVTAMTRRDDLKKWTASFDKKRFSFKPENKAKCFAGIAKKACNVLTSGAMRPSSIKGCEGVFDGTVADFENCNTSIECQSADATCLGGKCERPRGLLCGEDLCGANQACDFAAQKCISLKTVGQSCANFSECKTSNCTDGKCGMGAVVSRPGGSCLDNHVCPLGEECGGETCKPY